ncbi:MAG: hypothetical protein O9264_10940 [Leptospira sp.]|nr:hypothetical protein [Leptospira sp.]
MRSCSLGIKIGEVCPNDCKSSNKTLPISERKNQQCLATEKLTLFLEERLTFRIGVSAFSEAEPSLLEDFFFKSTENKELITYFLYINDPNLVKNIIENFSPSTLAYLFRADYNSYLNILANSPREKRKKSFFKVKSYRYWTYIHYQKLCDIIVYFIRELKEAEFAAQFLVVLPSNIVSNITKFTGLTPEEEKTLYLALGDAIYELPIQSPQIYDHMLSLFADDMEIFIILSTMEELIKRQQKIFETTEKLLEYTTKNKIEISIQFIFSELSGLDEGIAFEILNQLLERQVITSSQRNLILEILQTGGIDFLKRLTKDLI